MSDAWKRRLKQGTPGSGASTNGRAATGSRGVQTSTTTPQKLSADAKRFAKARRGGRLTTPMERYLITQLDERGQDNLLHVSDLVKNKWCPRMLYYRMHGIRPELESISFQLQNIFDYGSEAHGKYQGRWKDMGVLWGRWECMACNRKWLGMPLLRCDHCGAPGECIRYMEVPLADPEVLLIGNADGEIRDADGNVLAEIKTVGEGTFRTEAPKLLGQYTETATFENGTTEKQVNMKSLWKDLTRPLPSHSRQGQTYIALRALVKGEPPVDGISYLYEHKGNQGLKEFMVLPDQTVADQVLGRAKDVAWAIGRGMPPRCAEGRGGCDLCTPYEQEAKKDAHDTPPPRRAIYSGGARVR